MQKRIILLNGPSSSGKSTLAKCLQRSLKEKKALRFEIVSIDDFLKMTTEDTIYEDDVFEISRGMCEKALTALDSKDVVIIDHVITSKRIFDQLKEILASYQILLVHVTCPLNILKKRELERSNRCPGSAEASFEYLFPADGYDLTIDTHASAVEDCSQQIIELLS